MRSVWFIALLALASGCTKEQGGGSKGAPFAAGVVDSPVPRDLALRRFREGLDSVASLSGGAPSLDALGRAYAGALEIRDTAALRSLTLSKAEFAWLYYPTSAQGLPPYDLSPMLLWFTLEEPSQKGLRRALADRGGSPLHYLRTRCAGSSTTEGLNTLWGPCVLRYVGAPGDTVEERLFSQVIARGGIFKIVSHGNKL